MVCNIITTAFHCQLCRTSKDVRHIMGRLGERWLKVKEQEKKGWRKSRPVYISVIALVVVFIGVYGFATISMARQEMKIQVDGKVLHHKTLKRTVGEALTEAGVQVNSCDKVNPDADEMVKDGMLVVVERAFPVYVVADGSVKTIHTTRTSVRDVIELASLSLEEKDKVTPSLDSMVGPGSEIRVVRVTEETIKEQFSIPVAGERKPDSSLVKGQQRVVREGSPGEGERKIKVVYEDGKEVSRKTIMEQVLRPAVSRVVAYGTTSSISRGGNNIRYRKSLQVMSTAYGPSAGSFTATGHRVARGIVAVDPRVIPLGSRVYVDGYGHARALDVGGAIKGNRIDVFFPSEADCRRWGVRSVKVYILD